MVTQPRASLLVMRVWEGGYSPTLGRMWTLENLSRDELVICVYKLNYISLDSRGLFLGRSPVEVMNDVLRKKGACC